MWLPLFAALACTLTSPATSAPASRATGAMAAAMSLPLDAGPASAASGAGAAAPEMSLPAAELALALTPAVVECTEDAGAPPAPDCSVLASRWSADMVGTCELPRPSYARIAAIRRALAGSSRLAAAGALRELSPPLAGDPQNPFCPRAVAALQPAPASSPLSLVRVTTPASAPGRRLDRPPRA